MMTFRETLDRHLQAIQARDLEALMETVAKDEIMLITPDGLVVRSPWEFATMHREWFESGPWSLEITPLAVVESPALASTTLLLDYREGPRESRPASRRSLLTLIFALRDGAWVMVHDQNTRIQAATRGDQASV